MARLIQRTGCGLLLDINNIVVTTGNLGGAAQDYLAAIDPDWVGEIHLAGHATELHDSGPLYIDDHGSAVSARVWELYADFIQRARTKANPDRMGHGRSRLCDFDGRGRQG